MKKIILIVMTIAMIFTNDVLANLQLPIEVNPKEVDEKMEERLRYRPNDTVLIQNGARLLRTHWEHWGLYKVDSTFSAAAWYDTQQGGVREIIYWADVDRKFMWGGVLIPLLALTILFFSVARSTESISTTGFLWRVIVGTLVGIASLALGDIPDFIPIWIFLIMAVLAFFFLGPTMWLDGFGILTAAVVLGRLLYIGHSSTTNYWGAVIFIVCNAIVYFIAAYRRENYP